MKIIEGILSAIVWIVISISTVFWTILIGWVYLFRRWMDPELKKAHSFAGFWGRGLILISPACRVRVFGREHIPPGRPVIFMANHQSYMDVPALYFLRRQFKWMADKKLFRIPFFGWAMRMAGYVPVDRVNPRKGLRSLEQAKRWLARGISVFVFPEGTRSRTGQFSLFQTGGFRLAAAAGVEIVPVVLVGARQLLPRGSWIFRLGVGLQIHVLAPVKPPSGDARQVRQLVKEVRRRMESVYRRHLSDFKTKRGQTPSGVKGARSLFGV